MAASRPGPSSLLEILDHGESIAKVESRGCQSRALEPAKRELRPGCDHFRFAEETRLPSLVDFRTLLFDYQVRLAGAELRQPPVVFQLHAAVS